VGLGLAITDAIAKAHGGGCSVTSTETGSIFALHLPNFTPAVVEVPTRALVHQMTATPAPGKDLGPRAF
jgi:hypothetical protein